MKQDVSSAKVERLWQETLCGEAIARFFAGLDFRYHGLLVNTLATQIDVSGLDALGLEDFTLQRDAARAAFARVLTNVTSHHQCTNISVRQAAARLHADALVTARYRAPGMHGADQFTLHARWSFDFAEASPAPRISAIRVGATQSEGNPAVLTRAAARPDERRKPFAVSQDWPADLAGRLRLLEDRTAIADVMTRFGQALDTKNWRLYRECLCDRIVLDFSNSIGQPPREVDSDIFVQFAASRQRHHHSHHQYSNFQCAISGDHAQIRLNMLARHKGGATFGDDLNVYVGWYDNEMLRKGGVWKISALSNPLCWIEGNALIKDAPDPQSAEIVRRMFGS